MSTEPGTLDVLHEGAVPDPARPRVTFWVQCCDHQDFVADSVRSALSQSLQPMEIFISDDCSRDQTFTVARQLASEYRGPHRVALYQPAARRNGLGHFDEVTALLQGDIVILQSSDDIAEPWRAEALAAALADGYSVAWTNVQEVDAEGRGIRVHHTPDARPTLTIDDYAVGRHFDFSFGGAFGFVRADLARFGALPSQFCAVGLEHYVTMRGALVGGCRYLPRPSLRKREHGNNRTVGYRAIDRGRGVLEICRDRLAQRLAILSNQHADVARLHAVAPSPATTLLVSGLRRQIEGTQRRLQQLAFVDPGGVPASDPFRLALLGKTASGFNVCAYECRYFAVWQRRRAIEACLLRIGHYGEMPEADSLPALLAQIGSPAYTPLAPA